MQPTKKTCGNCGRWEHDPANPEKRIGTCSTDAERHGGYSVRMRSDKACDHWEAKE